MAPRGIRCALGNHNLRGTGVLITNAKHISFIKKAIPHFRPQERVCVQCKKAMENIYTNKLKRAIENQRRTLGSLSVSSSTTLSSDVSAFQLVNEQTSDRDPKTGNVDASTDSSNEPTTSAAAAARRQKKCQQQLIDKYKAPQERNVRLPNVQPYIRHQQFIHANPEIMNIYLQGLTGG
ncbi:uncharacterized protein LOC119640571 [Glossina fuscipes]|uniref:Uncharacterized protein LOC119640571 n=2 Tax=Nemorhina TaxID=44051 RepID=A0A9C5Z7U2_9MUSC|nr:uncharacterized protein LOC119640571 [Glossina fuscipes]KAI9578772.1 hypothetical protein GQX74_009346 [Glossina fuscipes]